MKDFLDRIKTAAGAFIVVAGFVALSMGCALLDAAADFSGKRVWDACMLPQVARAKIKGPVEAEAIAECMKDGQFTVAECGSISLSFGCPQDQVVP